MYIYQLKVKSFTKYMYAYSYIDIMACKNGMASTSVKTARLKVSAEFIEKF